MSGMALNGWPLQLMVVPFITLAYLTVGPDMAFVDNACHQIWRSNLQRQAHLRQKMPSSTSNTADWEGGAMIAA